MKKIVFLILTVFFLVSACNLLENETVTQTPTVPASTNTPIPSPTNTPPPTATPYPSEIEDDLGVSMILIPAGEFVMGTDTGEYDEDPAHVVYLDAFYIDKYEVTNTLFVDFLNDNLDKISVEDDGYIAYAGKVIYDLSQDRFGTSWIDYLLWDGAIFAVTPGYEEHAITASSWDTAEVYCEWRNARLPTEAEWEKAARGTDERKYPWGKNFDGNIVNACDVNCLAQTADDAFDDGFIFTSPVGMFPENVSPYGVFDMAGNVSEWVSDWYSSTYYEESPTENPLGPDTGNKRVFRGGSFQSSPNYAATDTLRTMYRGSHYPNVALPAFGFRCAMSIAP